MSTSSGNLEFPEQTNLSSQKQRMFPKHLAPGADGDVRSLHDRVCA